MYYLLKRHWSYVSECKVEADSLEEAISKSEDEDDIDADEEYE